MRNILLILSIFFVLCTSAFADTDFFLAAAYGDIDTVKNYIDSGYDVNTVDENGYTIFNSCFFWWSY